QAVSMSLVPVIASAYKRGETRFMQENINLGLRYASILSIPCAVGMSVLARPVMELFYPRVREAAASAGSCLALLAYGIIFLGMAHALNGILQGIGKQMIPVRNLCIGAVAKIAVTYTLTGVPSLNVRGAAIGTVVAYGVAATLDFLAMRKYTGTKVDYKLTFLKPCFCAAIMGLAVRVAYRLCYGHMRGLFCTAVSICTGIAVYGVLILATKAITVSEIERMPKGRKIAALLRRAGLR
nr:polysaccharide biosynthesis C-terminal domain-containing protein [Clostridia bacterium]